MKLLITIFLIYFHVVVSEITTNNDDKSTIAAIRKLVCKNATNTNDSEGFYIFV